MLCLYICTVTNSRIHFLQLLFYRIICLLKKLKEEGRASLFLEFTVFPAYVLFWSSSFLFVGPSHHWVPLLHLLLYAVIVKYVTFLYIIAPIIQSYTYCFMQSLFNSSKRRKEKTCNHTIFYNYPWVISFVGTFCLFV